MNFIPASAVPELLLFSSALLILMLDVFLTKKMKHCFYLSHFLTLIACTASILFVFHSFSNSGLFFNQMLKANSIIHFSKIVILLLLVAVVLSSFEFVYRNAKISAEFLSLIMISTVGSMILISANNFLVFYLGLELQSLPLYLLAAINRNSFKSCEAGMKYFILGSVSSGIMLFGISMIYGFSGNINFSDIVELYRGSSIKEIPLAVIFGFVMVCTAMFFKISAAPFHMWMPDVYQGSPEIVTKFFATVVKFSSALALINLLFSLKVLCFGLEKVLIFVGVLSLIVGSLGAIFQQNIKRMLAYSSIGHIGFVLVSLMVFNGFYQSVVIFYLVVYSIISVGAFGFLLLIQSSSNSDNEVSADNKIFAISSLAGLSKKNPVMAFSFSAIMLSSAGIPPLAGFFSKFYIFIAIIGSNHFILAAIVAIFSVISAFYYLRIVKIIYFDEPKNELVIDDNPNIKLMVLAVAIVNIAAVFVFSKLMNVIQFFVGV